MRLEGMLPRSDAPAEVRQGGMEVGTVSQLLTIAISYSGDGRYCVTSAAFIYKYKIYLCDVASYLQWHHTKNSARVVSIAVRSRRQRHR